MGREEIWMSRPWDLTEIVPLHERRWFQVSAIIIALFICVLLLAVILS